MPRTKEFDPDEALRKAVEVFWEKGFEAASMEELVEATGASRYGIYTTFGDKRQFFLKALEHYCESVRKSMYAPLLEPGANLDDLRAFFEHLVGERLAVSSKNGCLACRAVVEIAPEDADVDAILTRTFDKIEATFRQVLQNAKVEGQIEESLDLGLIAAALTGYIQAGGALVRTPSTHPRLKAMLENLLGSLG